MTVITITNDGPLITATNYWAMPHAARGLCYLSANAGALRLLVPRAAEGVMLPEMRTGRSVSIGHSVHMSGSAWDVVFEDGTDSPWSLAIDKQQLDRSLTPGACRMLVYSESGLQLDLPCEVRL